jgi:REP element-mobilizing transposase RayT
METRLLALELQRVAAAGLAASLAWVIMPDHFHWLIILGDTTLDRLMRNVKSRSAIAVNRWLSGEDPFASKLAPTSERSQFASKVAPTSEKPLSRRSELARERSQPRDAKVWQSGFHDHALRSEDDLRTVARYIVANPLRAGLVHDLRRYPLWNATWL